MNARPVAGCTQDVVDAMEKVKGEEGDSERTVLI